MTSLLVNLLQPEILAHDGKAVTTSTAVAEYFHKRHDHVIDKIRTTIAECDPAWHLPNFREMVREVPGGDGAVRKMPMFELTRDAFVLIAMGFTGKKALQWKINYINAFNRMEDELNHRSHPTPTHRHKQRFVIYMENGLVTCQRPVLDSEYICTIEAFLEIARKADYVVIHKDDLLKKLAS